MYRAYNPYPVVLVPRRLPAGDCTFVLGADKLIMGQIITATHCGCRTFWPNPHNGELCACGHHACFHSQEPSPAPAPSKSPTGSTSMAAYTHLSKRLSKLESYLAAGGEAKQAVAGVGGGQHDFKEDFANAVYDAFEKIGELVERMEEAEERLFGVERSGVELVDRIDDVDRTIEEMQEEIDAVKGDDGAGESGGEEEENRPVLADEDRKGEQGENCPVLADEDWKGEQGPKIIIRSKGRDQEVTRIVLKEKRKSSCPEGREEQQPPKRFRLGFKCSSE